jgi:4-coumarate--CoA ligase
MLILLADHQDVLPVVLPVFHIYGFTMISMHGFMRGAKLITLPKFSPQLYSECLLKNPCNVLYIVPPLCKK